MQQSNKRRARGKTSSIVVVSEGQLKKAGEEQTHLEEGLRCSSGNKCKTMNRSKSSKELET